MDDEEDDNEGEDFANPFIDGEAIEDDSEMEEQKEHEEEGEVFLQTPEYFLRESNDHFEEHPEHSWEMFD